MGVWVLSRASALVPHLLLYLYFCYHATGFNLCKFKFGMDDNCGEWVEYMGVASGCGEQEAGVASGSGWNLWVWLAGGGCGKWEWVESMGAVSRR